MIEVWNIKKENYPGYLAAAINSNGADLPPALPWVEPTINNLWLEACESFLYGNYGSMRFSVGEAYATTASLPGE